MYISRTLHENVQKGSHDLMTVGPAKMRTTIVDTAYHYACEHGLSSLSIRTIAKECSVSVGSIYNYFPVKQLW